MEELNNITKANQFKENELTAEFVAFYFFYALIGLLIIVMNSTVLHLIWKFKFLHTVTNLCLACLAGSDLLSGLVATPLVISCTFKYTFQVCLLMELTQRFIAVSTILHLLIVALERYVMICHPMIYPNIATKPRVLTVLAGVWGFALLSSLIQLAWILPTKDKFTSDNLQTTEIIYDLIWVFGLVCVPMLIIIVSYVRLLLVLRKQLQEIARQVFQVEGVRAFKIKERERKAIMIYGTMVAIFIMSWFSYILFAILYDFRQQVVVPEAVRNFLPIVRHSCGLLNPLLYTFVKVDFKKAIRLLFSRHTGVPRGNRHQSMNKILKAVTEL